MRSRKVLFIIFTIISIYPSHLFAQQMMIRERVPNENDYGGSLFQMAYYDFADSSAELSKIEFHVSFVNDILTFIKEDNDLFKAKYEMVVEVLDKKNIPLMDKSVSGEVIANSFRETNDRIRKIHKDISLSASPGKYKFRLTLLDMETKRNIIRERDIILREFSPEAIHLSDIMFLDLVQYLDHGKIRIMPNLNANFASRKSDFSAYFEIYLPSNLDSLDVEYKVIDEYDNIIFEEKDKKNVDSEVIRQIIQMKDKVTRPGKYSLIAKATAGDNVAEQKRQFSVHWGRVVFNTGNIEIAVKPLAIIANKSDIREMENADEETRNKLFDEFWSHRDPTPGTERNELKEEFFRRVDFANRNFATLTNDHEGWATDRGKVYIQYGPPTEVERQPTDINMPAAEIWFYAEIDRHFIFSDPSGTGNYRLVRVD